jgi:hypothetical protein
LENWGIYPDQAEPPGKLVNTGASTQIKLGLQANWQKLEHLPDKAGPRGKLVKTGA